MPGTSMLAVTNLGDGPRGSCCSSWATVSIVSAISAGLFALLSAGAGGVLRDARAAHRRGVLRTPIRQHIPRAGSARHRLAAFEPVYQRVRRLRRHTLDKLAVHLEHWRHAAGSQALHATQGIASVGARLATPDGQPLLQVRQQMVAAAEVARDAGADVDDVTARRLAKVHRVEGDDGLDLVALAAGDLGDRGDPFRCDVALLLLGQVQAEERAGARLGIART